MCMGFYLTQQPREGQYNFVTWLCIIQFLPFFKSAYIMNKYIHLDPLLSNHRFWWMGGIRLFYIQEAVSMFCPPEHYDLTTTSIFSKCSLRDKQLHLILHTHNMKNTQTTMINVHWVLVNEVSPDFKNEVFHFVIISCQYLPSPRSSDRRQKKER